MTVTFSGEIVLRKADSLQLAIWLLLACLFNILAAA